MVNVVPKIIYPFNVLIVFVLLATSINACYMAYSAVLTSPVYVTT